MPPPHQVIDLGSPPPPDEGPKKYDTAGPFFSLYSDVAGDVDNKMAERWQQDATDGILVFSGLFSAAVTVLLAVSIPDLQQTSQDTSAMYLANIYQIFADPNFTFPRTSIPPTIANSTTFSPPTHAIWVNTLWFLSLTISLSCALLAMSLRQWARRYVRLTRQEGHTANERARMHAFFSRDENIWAVEALPAMLHLSFFLFFSGLLVFLFNINHRTFIYVASCIGLFALVYVWITFLPIFSPNTPYYGPLSPVAWFLYALLQSALLQPLAFLRSVRGQLKAAWQNTYSFCQGLRIPIRRLARDYGYWMSTGLRKVAEEAVEKDIPKTDEGILQWTMKNTLGEDNKLERFFQVIPGLLQSDQSSISVTHLTHLDNFWEELDNFLHRTLLSDSVDESIKAFRLGAYFNLINEKSEFHDDTWFILDVLQELLRGNFGDFPQKIKRMSILARWCTEQGGEIALAAQCVVTRLLRSAQTHDRLWIAYAMDQLDIPHHLLDNMIDRDEHSVSMAILIHMTSRIRDREIWNLWYLTSLCDFHPQKASCQLQNEFCALWNRFAEEAREEGPYSDPVDVLRAIRQVYIALHQGTEAAPTAFHASTDDFDGILFDPLSYPVCCVDHLDPTTAVPSTQLDNPDVGAAHPPPQPQELPSTSPITDPMHLPPQIASVTDPSIREFIQMFALNLMRLVSTKVHDSVQQQPGVTSQASEELTRVPPTVSESQSSPVMPPVLHNGVILIVPTSPVESSPVRPDRVSPTFGPPSSLLATTGLPSPPTDREHNFE